MAESAPPEVKPSTPNLADLLKWVQQGRIRLPRFQRPFRWDRSRVVDLFDSVRRQYPIGSFLFWTPTNPPVTAPNLGPLRLPAGPSDLLLIDGQQRLASLAGVLLAGKLPVAADLEDPGMWDLWFDGKEQAFWHPSKKPAPYSSIKVADLLDVRTLMKASTAIQDHEDADAILAAWQDCASAFGSYRFPIVEFKTEDLRLAVESFTRLNRRGLDISPDEMYSALADDGSDAMRLTDYIDDILKTVSDEGFGELDRITVLRLIFLELGLDPFRTDWSKLAEETQRSARQRLDTVAAQSKRALLRALRFLRDDLHLVSLRLLPYSGILIGAATFLGPEDEEPSPPRRQALERWCWHAAFVGFAEGNPSRSVAAWRHLQRRRVDFRDDQSLGQVAPDFSAASAYPSRFTLKSARVQATLWAAVRAASLAPDDRERLGLFLDTHGNKAIPRLYRTKRSASPRFKMLLSSPANRVLDLPDLHQMRPPTEPLAPTLRKSLEEKSLDARFSFYGFDEAAYRALRNDDPEVCLEARLTALIEAERAFMKNRGIPLPPTMDPAPSAIDHPEQGGWTDESNDD